MTRLSALLARLFDLLAVAAALILFAMVVLVTADIVLRNTARVGFAWANEITEYALYLITLLTAPWLLRRGQHVRIDMMLVLVPPRIAWLMEAVADIVGLAASLVLIWYGTIMTVQSARLGSLTIKNLVFPEWWLLWPLPLCFVLLALEFVFRFHRLMGAPRTRRIEATSVG
ncbi:MAG: TRAP-type transport system small permease protein [Hyphomicrobiales bacterium]|jgi:TRAP-type C4-dicarboxylate transport system permease small subunit|nr:TRAP-type transport system small permease protein [Hyphomicrobiales bacterium]